MTAAMSGRSERAWDVANCKASVRIGLAVKSYERHTTARPIFARVMHFASQRVGNERLALEVQTAMRAMRAMRA